MPWIASKYTIKFQKFNVHLYTKFSERILESKKFDHVFFDVFSSYYMSFIKLLYLPRTITALNKQVDLCNDLT